MLAGHRPALLAPTLSTGARVAVGLTSGVSRTLLLTGSEIPLRAAFVRDQDAPRLHVIVIDAHVELKDVLDRLRGPRVALITTGGRMLGSRHRTGQVWRFRIEDSVRTVVAGQRCTALLPTSWWLGTVEALGLLLLDVHEVCNVASCRELGRRVVLHLDVVGVENLLACTIVSHLDNANVRVILLAAVGQYRHIDGHVSGLLGGCRMNL